MDWDINQIKHVEKAYDKVSRGIQYQKQELLDNILNESHKKQCKDI